MSFKAVRNLSPVFVRDVVPLLSSGPSPGDMSDYESLRAAMSRLGESKDRALRMNWPQLLETVSVQNIKISMRDGFEEELRIFSPMGSLPASGLRTVVYAVHGGGFVAGSNDSEDLINRQLCSTCGVTVFSLAYRLAPEHKVVTTLFEDVEDGLKWVYKNASKYYGDIQKGVFLSGTSVGAPLSSMLAYRSESLGVLVKGLVLRQPQFIFGTYDTVAKKEWLPVLKSRVENYDSPVMSGDIVEKFSRLISIAPEDAMKPDNFQIFASPTKLASMPPTYMALATCDPVVDEAELFNRLLNKAGVATKVARYEGMPHGCHAYHQLQAARDELRDTAEGLKWLMELAKDNKM